MATCSKSFLYSLTSLDYEYVANHHDRTLFMLPIPALPALCSSPQSSVVTKRLSPLLQDKTSTTPSMFHSEISSITSVDVTEMLLPL